MDARTRRFVLELLKTAHDQACRSVEPDLARLAPEERRAVLDAIDALRACLLHQLEGTLPAPEAEARVAALIHGHPAAPAVHAMEAYAHLLVDLLTTSRNGLTPVRRSREH